MKRIAFFIDSMGGGGAQRVVSVLSKEFIKQGYKVDILMIYKRPIQYDLEDNVSVYYAEDIPLSTWWGKFITKVFDCWTYIRRRFYIPFLRRLGNMTYAKWNETSFYFYAKFALPYRAYLKKTKPDVAFGFLIRSNIAMLQAARGTDIKTVFCERNNPIRPDMPAPIIKIRDRIYTRCKAAVFQTEEERKYYKKLKVESEVIPNPLKDGLPERFTGVRKHEIVNFCRLNKQKNIPLLIEAFEMFLHDYPDYILRIYGRGEEKENIASYIQQKELNQHIFLEDFVVDIHDRIRDAAMFVFTSDYEGLSNSMIEAMAIGLPCICTDCDGGGARMMIHDHENGILVEKGNAKAVYESMKELVLNPDLANKLSLNSAKIVQDLNINTISRQWESLIY